MNRLRRTGESDGLAARGSASRRAGTPRWRSRFCVASWRGRPPGPPSATRRGNDPHRIDLRRGEWAHRALRLGKGGPKQSEVPALGPGSVLARKPRQPLRHCRRQSHQTVGSRGPHPFIIDRPCSCGNQGLLAPFRPTLACLDKTIACVDRHARLKRSPGNTGRDKEK